MIQRLLTLNPDKLFVVILLVFLFQEGIFIDKRVTVDEVWHSVPVYRAGEDGPFTVKAIKEGAGYAKIYQLAGYQSILILWHSIFPEEIIYSRIFSLLFGLLILVSIYFLSKRIWKNSLWALIPAAALAFDNIFFITSITVRSDIVIAAGIPVILLTIYDDEWKLRPRQLFWAGVISLIFISMHPNFLLASTAFIIAYFIAEAKSHSIKQNLQNIFFYGSPFLIVAFLVITSSISMGFDLTGFITPYVTKTLELSAITSFNVKAVFLKEWNRYLDFMQFPFRVHLFIILILSASLPLFAKEKAIKFISIIISIILIFFLALHTKSARYLVLLLPLVYLSFTFVAYQIYNKVKGKYIEWCIIPGVISLVIISFAGNIYLINKYWNTAYKEFSDKLYFTTSEGEKVVGDLILWDTFKYSDFSAYPSGEMELNNYNYVITRYGVYGNNNIIMSRSNTFSRAGNKKRRDDGYKIIEAAIAERGTLIKEVDNYYYGNFKIYKLNSGKK